MSASLSEPAPAQTTPTNNTLRPVSSRASSRTGNHSLQLPGCEQPKLGPSGTKIPQIYLKTLFDDTFDELHEYCALICLHGLRAKSFSTNDIVWSSSNDNDDSPSANSGTIITSLTSGSGGGSANNNNNNNNNNGMTSARKYLSECDLITYSRHQNYMKDINNDYITYSCSTLAICGDTVHTSSQLPSPQTQSIRHLANSFMLSDLDLIKSLSKKMRLDCIRDRQRELLRTLQPGTITQNEYNRINGVHCKPIVGPFQYETSTGNELLTDQGDILIQVIDCGTDGSHHKPIPAVHKKDRELFVLNWLQNVESNPAEQFEPQQ